MFPTAFVIPTCSETCKCVPNDIKEFLTKQGIADKIIGIPIKSTADNYQGAKEAFKHILQRMDATDDPVLILNQKITPALLFFMLGIGEMKSVPLIGRLRILVREQGSFRLIDPRKESFY